MSRQQLELEGVFHSPLEAYRLEAELGAQHGGRTLVLSIPGPGRTTTWEVYSYAAVRGAHRGPIPVIPSTRRGSGGASSRITAKELALQLPAPRPSRPPPAQRVLRAGAAS